VWYRDPNNNTIGPAINLKKHYSAPSAYCVAEENVSVPIGAYEYYGYKREQYYTFQYTKTVQPWKTTTSSHGIRHSNVWHHVALLGSISLVNTPATGSSIRITGVSLSLQSNTRFFLQMQMQNWPCWKEGISRHGKL